MCSDVKLVSPQARQNHGGHQIEILLDRAWNTADALDHVEARQLSRAQAQFQAASRDAFPALSRAVAGLVAARVTGAAAAVSAIGAGTAGMVGRASARILVRIWLHLGLSFMWHLRAGTDLHFFAQKQQGKPEKDPFPDKPLEHAPVAAAMTVSMEALALEAAPLAAATPPSRIAIQVSCGTRGSRTSGCDTMTGICGVC